MAGNDVKQMTVVIAVDASSKAEEAVHCKYILLHVFPRLLCPVFTNTLGKFHNRFKDKTSNYIM